MRPALALLSFVTLISCAPDAAPQAVSQVPDAELGPIAPSVHEWDLDYDPQHLALAWTAQGRELVVAHLEGYSAYDMATGGCAETGIFAVPIEGGKSRLVARSAALCAALTSSDGAAFRPALDRLVYVASVPTNQWRLFLLELSAHEPKQLPPPCDKSWGVLEPGAWSPQGNRIAFVSGCDHPEGHSALFLVSPDGRGLRRLAAPTRWDEGAPAWAPDGSRIAFTQSTGAIELGDDSIAVMDTLGRDRRVLAQGWSPAWSPDGQWIAFFRDERLGDYERMGTIRVVRVDGRGEREVFRSPEKSKMSRGWGPFLEGQPRGPLVWSPDSRWLVFGRTFHTGTTIWRLRLEDSRLDQVTIRRDPSSSRSRKDGA